MPEQCLIDAVLGNDLFVINLQTIYAIINSAKFLFSEWYDFMWYWAEIMLNNCVRNLKAVFKVKIGVFDAELDILSAWLWFIFSQNYRLAKRNICSLAVWVGFLTLARIEGELFESIDTIHNGFGATW